MSAAYLEALHADQEPANAGVESAGGSSNVASGSIAQAAAGGGATKKRAANIDFDSESAFPSLGAASSATTSAGSSWSIAAGKGKGKKPATAANGWNGSTGSHLQPPSAAASDADGSRPATPAFTAASRPAQIKDTLVLSASSIQLGTSAQAPRRRGEEPVPTSLGEAVGQTMRAVSGVKIDATTSKSQTTFLFRGASQDLLDKARQDLLGRIARKITVTVEIPSSSRAIIIGTKGRTLKQIIDGSGAQIQLPPRDPSAVGDDLYEENDADSDPLVSLTVTGTEEACSIARERIEGIVAERMSKIVHTSTLPANSFEAVYWPLVRKQLGTSWSEDGVTVSLAENGAVEAKGEKAKAAHSIEEVSQVYQELKKSCRVSTISLAKRQLRLLDSSVAEEILQETGFSIELPSLASSNESVTIRGPGDNKARSAAMLLVMDKADAAQVDGIEVLSIHSSPESHAANVCRYLSRSNVFDELSGNVQFYLPTEEQIAAHHYDIDLSAENAEALAPVKEKAEAIIKGLTPQKLQSVQLDQLLHKRLQSAGKKAKAVESLKQSNKGLEIVFPLDGEKSDVIFLVWKDASKGALDNAKQEFSKLISDLDNLKITGLSIPAKFHKAIQGPNRTNLNAIIGEEQEIAINFGPGDKVEIRAPKEEIERVQKDIERLAQEAETEGVENSFEAEFEIDGRVVSHIVGKGGAGISKLRDDLGVRVDFTEAEQASSSAGTAAAGKKRAPRPKAHVLIRGRKANVEEAKKRILAQADRIADEVAITLPLPAGVDRGTLIGKQGAYAQRLETKYEVRINFSRPEDASDEVSIRGPKKGAESARKELLELMEYEKENNHTTTISVSSKAIPRILGKQGVQVNEIAAETGATIELDRKDDKNTVVIRGTKTAIAAAKKLVAGIAKETDEETVVTVNVPRALHNTLIGKGGQNIRDLMARVGGPTDSRSQGYLLRFPRPEDASADTITLRGKSSIVEKLKEELMKDVTALQNRVVLGVSIPASSHAAIIGRQGSTVNELSTKHNVKVVFPNWKDNSVSGELSNADEVADSAPADLIRIAGTPEGCAAAAEAMKAIVASSASASNGKASSGGRSGSSSSSHIRTVDVPAHLHSAVGDGGRFFRNLPRGVNITHNNAQLPSRITKPKPFANGKPTSSARIDQDEDEADSDFVWDMQPLFAESTSEETIPWVITGNNESNVIEAEKQVHESLEKAKKGTHIAFMQVPPGYIGKVVGRGGSGLERLRNEADVFVEVLGRKDADTLSLTGTPASLEKARSMIEGLKNQGRQ